MVEILLCKYYCGIVEARVRATYLASGGKITEQQKTMRSARDPAGCKGADQESLPKYDATTEARRNAELQDEEIRAAFEQHRRIHRWECQRECRQSSRTDISRNVFGSFAVCSTYFGRASDSLAAIVESCYDKDKQLRKPIAYVQSPGCAKTRTVMQLAQDYDYVVLPLALGFPYSMSKLLKAVTESQDSLKEDLGKQPSGEQIRTFSDRCLRLVHLMLFSVHALFKHCVAMKLVDVWNADDRYDLAVLPQSMCEPLENWLLAYFNEHKQAFLDMATSEFETLVNETVTDKLKPGTRIPKVVFLLHKAHYAMVCKRFSLHIDAPEDDEEMREEWLANQHRWNENTTDLLYQLKQVMVKCSQIDGSRMAFVISSSKMKVADSIVHDSSAKTGVGDMIRFSDMHWFTAEDVRQYIEEHLDVPDWIFTEKRMVALSRIGHPYCVASLPSARSSISEGLVCYVDGAVREASQLALQYADRAIDKFAKCCRRQILDDNVPGRLKYSVYAMMWLYGGQCVLREKFVRKLVRNCVVRLTAVAANEVICDDQAILSDFHRKVVHKFSAANYREGRDPVLQELVAPLIVNVNNELSVRSIGLERILAWLAYRGKLQLVTRNEQFCFCYPLDGCCACTTQQLERLHPYELYGAADCVWRFLVKHEDRSVLFPKNHCGPDLVVTSKQWMRWILVGRCEMDGNGKVLELDKFKKIVTSLHPAHYFETTKKKDGSDEYRIAERQRWLENFLYGYKLLSKINTFHRIVFAVHGFALHVQYLVAEYNASVGRESRKLIHLMQLHDLKRVMDEENYAALENLVKDTTGQVHVQAHEAVMLQSEWIRMSTLEKENTSFEELEKLCLQRNISVTKPVENGNGDKYWMNKTAGELIKELNAYDVLSMLADLNWKLDFF